MRSVSFIYLYFFEFYVVGSVFIFLWSWTMISFECIIKILVDQILWLRFVISGFCAVCTISYSSQASYRRMQIFTCSKLELNRNGKIPSALMEENGLSPAVERLTLITCGWKRYRNLRYYFPSYAAKVYCLPNKLIWSKSAYPGYWIVDGFDWGTIWGVWWDLWRSCQCAPEAGQTCSVDQDSNKRGCSGLALFLFCTLLRLHILLIFYVVLYIVLKPVIHEIIASSQDTLCSLSSYLWLGLFLFANYDLFWDPM